MPQHPRRVGIYCRLSYAPDGKLEKVERQEADCRQLADRLAWPISEQHVESDNNRSAWKRNRKRPGWDRLLAAIDAGEIDALIVYHGDRLIRQPHDLEKLITVAESKALRIASPSGTRNLDSADDRFILRIEAAQACKASDDTSRRVKRALDAKAAQGLPRAAGRRAFGFEQGNITHRPDEAALLRQAAERLLAGHSVNAVVSWMDERSTTSLGGPWSSRTLTALLTSPRVAGLMAGDGELVPGAWEPILDRATWEDLRALMEERREETPYPGQERKYLLTGIARCSTCEGRMIAHWVKGKRKQVYWCRNRGCEGGMVRAMHHLDAYVQGRVLEVLNDPEILDGLLAPGGADSAQEIAQLERRRAKAKEQLENLADQDEEIDAGLLARSLSSFDRKIGQLRAARAATANQRLIARMAGITRQAWDATPIDVRSATVRALFVVTVLPATWRGPGFDPASVRLDPVTG